jgi:hypothetical protein
MLRLALVVSAVAVDSVSAHASLLWPLPRGGVDRSLPEFAGGSFPPGHYDCKCTNATEPGAVCLSAQSCLWCAVVLARVCLQQYTTFAPKSVTL